MDSVYGDGAWFASALQNAGDMVIVVSTDTTILWGNRAVEDILGWKVDEMIGRSFVEVVHPDDLNRAAEVVALLADRAFERDVIRPALYRLRHADGSWMTIEVNSATVPSASGELLLICRFTGDLVFGAELMEAITRGAPFEEQVAITMELGSWRYPDEGHAIVYRGADGYVATAGPSVPVEVLDVDADLSVWRRAIELDQIVKIDDLRDRDARTGLISDAHAEAALAAGFVGCLAMPVEDPGYGDNAAILVWARPGGPTLTGHRYAVATMAQCLTLVLQQRAQLIQLEQMAYTDPLTGICSRRRFLEELDQADADWDECRHAVLYVDLDGFKQVNDRFGHTVGDQVLAVTAGRVAAVLPSGAVVGRLGGDEFGVLCPRGTSVGDVEKLAARIGEVIAEPIHHEFGETVIGGTVGWCIGDSGVSASKVLDLADRSLLDARAKRNRPAPSA
ncbi:MAG: diguanylate cyclase [Acidimicrobiales bacterium]|nr:diguanylate cyclase [Acidimicrobiales bacterium]